MKNNNKVVVHGTLVDGINYESLIESASKMPSFIENMYPEQDNIQSFDTRSKSLIKTRRLNRKPIGQRKRGGSDEY